MTYVMLPAMLNISECKWLMCYIFLSLKHIPFRSFSKTPKCDY